MDFIKRSILKKIVSVIGISVVVIMIFSNSYIFSNSKEMISDIEKDNMKVKTELALEKILLKIEKASAFVLSASEIEFMKDMDFEKAFSYFSKNISNTDFLLTFLIDSNGNYVSHAGKQKSNLSSRDYFQKIMSGHNGIYVTEPVVSSSTGKKTIIITHAVKKDNRIVGVMAGSLDLDKLTEFTGTLKAGNTGYAFLVDRNGIIIAHPDKDLIMKENIITNTSGRYKDISQKLFNSENGLIEFKDNGKNMLIAYNSIPLADFKICIAIPEKEFFTNINALSRNTIVFSVLMLGLLISLIIIVASKIVQNIKKLNDRVGQISQGDGDLTKRIEIDTIDETKILADKVNDFISNVHQVITSVYQNMQVLIEVNNTVNSEISQLIDSINTQAESVSGDNSSITGIIS